MNQKPKQQGQVVTAVVDATNMMKELRGFEERMKRSMREAATPVQKPQSLNESAGPVQEDYKPGLIEALKGRRKISYSEGVTTRKMMQEAIGSLVGGSAIPEIWAAEVERLHVYPNSKFLSVPGLVNWKDDITGAPGDTINVPTVEKVVAVSVQEGAEPTISAATVSSVPVTLATIGAAYYMTKSDVEELIPSTVDALNAGLGSAIAEKVDTDYLGYCDSPNGLAGGTLTTAILGTVGMTGSILARAIGSMRARTYEPAFYVCHPLTLIKMLQEQRFYDASQFGTREVAERGAIANYFGVDIITTPVVPNSGGTYKSFLLAKGACVGAVKRRPEIETDYIIESGRHYVRMDMRWGGTIVHLHGLFEVNTYD